MSGAAEGKSSLKDMLKHLRSQRAETYDRAKGANKELRLLRGRIKKALADEPKTVPSLAAELGIATDQVLWHVMAMRKYGLVAEGEQEEEYFRYRLVPKAEKGK